MKAPSNLQPLFAQLQACPTRENCVTEKLLMETWGSFRQIALEHGDAVTSAVIAGVILYDEETFAPLLNEAERAQLAALGKAALERYQQQTNPPNPLGKTIAASLKEKI